MFESALYANYEQEKQWLVMSEGSPTKLLSILGGECELRMILISYVITKRAIIYFFDYSVVTCSSILL